jgi:hypothetical protein
LRPRKIDRPSGVRRNTENGPKFRNISLRVTTLPAREFQLGLRWV